MNAPEADKVPGGIVGRFLFAFHPSSLPVLARASYRLELASTLLFSFALAMVEGGVIGVFTKNTFTSRVSDSTLDYAAAVVAAAADFANLTSFVWAVWAHGKDRVKFINYLQIAVVVLVTLIACVKQTSGGLLMLTICVIAARMCWSGILTIRPSIWHNNYQRTVRARIVGNFAAVQVVIVASMGLLLGFLMDRSPDAFRVLLPICAVFAFAAFLVLRKLRVRGARKELRSLSRRPGLKELARVLIHDGFFARFQMCMFVLGLGNLMLTPILVIVLKERFGMGYFSAILITVGIIQLCTPLFIPMWARVLDRAHVVTFRSVHSWSFVAALIIFMCATHFQLVWLMYLAALIQSISLAGGSIAWNIGHHDFASPVDSSRYMAVHVTINGIRGLLAPIIAVSGYHWFERHGLEASTWMMSICCVVCSCGGLGFVWLRHYMGAQRLAIARS